MNTELICFFQDYLSDLDPREKISILKEAGVEVLGHPESDLWESNQARYGRLPRRQYSGLVDEFRHIFARNASRALSAFVLAHPESAAVRNLSGASRETLYIIAKEFAGNFQDEREFEGRFPPIHQQLASWALDPRNWYLIAAEEGPVTIQSKIWPSFPCLVFGNGPIECAMSQDPETQFDHLEDILQSTGIYGLWSSGHLGEGATAVVLDTGVTQRMMGEGINATAVTGLSPVDVDGHGSAIVSLIRALSPQSTIESICVTQTYSGGQIWNLTSGLTRLFGRRNNIINLSLGASPEWVRALGAQASGFRDSMASILGSLASTMNFAVSAAGNDGIPELRWPAAAADSLAVASHNGAFGLSSFSNFRAEATNLVLAPGGELRQLDGKIESFGRYGSGAAREVFGTSFSTAVASAMSCLLMDCQWFSQMQIPSRISLFRNHCRKNDKGQTILNAIDIGAVWPI
jgi:hypothetical protein